MGSVAAHVRLSAVSHTPRDGLGLQHHPSLTDSAGPVLEPSKSFVQVLSTHFMLQSVCLL